MSSLPVAFRGGDASPRARHWLVDHNPLYLLSGVSMLAGCFALNLAIGAEDAPLNKLVVLIGVFNVYEVCVIGLSAWLVRRQRLPRDAAQLLGLALVLLADGTLVYQQLATLSLTGGIITGGLATLLGLAKLWVMQRAVGLKLSPAGWAVTAADVAAVFALPAIVRAMGPDGRLTLIEAYPLWWAMGLLVAAHALPGRWWSRPEAGEDHRPARSVVALSPGILLALAWLHLPALHVVYQSQWDVALLVPVAIGLAAAIARLRSESLAERPALRFGAVGACVAFATVASLSNPEALVGGLADAKFAKIAPMRLNLVALVSLLAAVGWSQRSALSFAGAGVYALLATLGHTPAALRETLGWAAEHGRTAMHTLGDWLALLWPRSLMAWGVLGIALAFVLLVMGALVSRWSGPVEHDG